MRNSLESQPSRYRHISSTTIPRFSALTLGDPERRQEVSRHSCIYESVIFDIFIKLSTRISQSLIWNLIWFCCLAIHITTRGFISSSNSGFVLLDHFLAPAACAVVIGDTLLAIISSDCYRGSLFIVLDVIGSISFIVLIVWEESETLSGLLISLVMLRASRLSLLVTTIALAPQVAKRWAIGQTREHTRAIARRLSWYIGPRVAACILFLSLLNTVGGTVPDLARILVTLVLLCLAPPFIWWAVVTHLAIPLDDLLAGISRFSLNGSVATDTASSIGSVNREAKEFSAEVGTLDRLHDRLNLLSNSGNPLLHSQGHSVADLAVLHSVTASQAHLPAEHPGATARPNSRLSRASAPHLDQGVSQRSLRNHAMWADRLNSWEFDSLALSSIDSFAALEHIFYHSSEAVFVNRVPLEVFSAFISTVENKYNPNPYHKWAHAIDVCHTVYRYLGLTNARDFLKPMDRLGLLVAALIHDIGHIAVNNQFLIETGHELAIRFNDKSPLENFHCATFFELLNEESCNVLKWLTKDQMKEFRKVVIESVLHTDNAFHFGMVKDLTVLMELHAEMLADRSRRTEVLDFLKTQETRALINKLFLHSADISNPTKPFSICKGWAFLVMEEFFAQGDQEMLLGLPVQPLNDRSKGNIPQCQMGFIEFVVSPLMALLLRLFPSFRDNCQFLVSNMIQWASESVTAQTCSEEESKLIERCRKVANTFDGVSGMGGLFVPQSLRQSASPDYQVVLPNYVSHV